MYRRYVLLIASALALCWVAPAQGGLYNPGESDEGAIYPDFINGPPGRNFRDVVLNLRTISVKLPQVDNPVRRRYVFMEELLGKTSAAGLPTTQDRLQGSAVLVRRRKFKEAEQMLRPIATAQGQLANIPVQSNFATALHLGGELQNAYYTLRPVVEKHWPAHWDELSEDGRRDLESLGWNEGLFTFYRDCDSRYLKLLRLRLTEQRAKKKEEGLVQPPDVIFDDGKQPPAPVRFVGESGDFEAGKIASPEKAKLPPNALPIVQQLNVWMPDDLRLYWLLGELYNAQGGEQGIRAAYQVFIDLSKIEPVSDEVKRELRTRIGVLSNAVEAFDREQASKFGKEFKQIEKQSDAFPIDWRTVVVSFGVGFLLALFAVWQVREIMRRRQARQAGRNVHPV